VQRVRRRFELEKAPGPCALCGSQDVVVVESRALRRGLDRVNPTFHASPHRYDFCRACGARRGDG